MQKGEWNYMKLLKNNYVKFIIVLYLIVSYGILTVHVYLCGKDLNPSYLHIIEFAFITYIFNWWAVLFGIIGEVSQIWIPGRYFEWSDIMFNFMGISIGFVISLICRKRGDGI